LAQYFHVAWFDYPTRQGSKSASDYKLRYVVRDFDLPITVDVPKSWYILAAYTDLRASYIPPDKLHFLNMQIPRKPHLHTTQIIDIKN